MAWEKSLFHETRIYITKSIFTSLEFTNARTVEFTQLVNCPRETEFYKQMVLTLALLIYLYWNLLPQI